MGINGLSTFLAQHKHAKYEKRLMLHDEIIVIDGNNLMYFLLHHRPGLNSHLVGTDYVNYATKVREFFQHLKDCRIVPIVIFDGACEPEKWNTVFQRYKHSVKTNVYSSRPGNTYTPSLMSIVFREILEEQRILHYQTQLEGDDTMAFIAKRLKCSILSSDSDFYIYPSIQNIPLGTIEFRKSKITIGIDVNGKPKTEKRFCLAADVLSIHELCRQKFKFKDDRLLPLAAVILGNDRISSLSFSRVHYKKATGDKSTRIEYVLEWLGNGKGYDHILEVILQSLKESERLAMRQLVTQVLRNYEGDHGELQVWKMVLEDLKTVASHKIPKALGVEQTNLEDSSDCEANSSDESKHTEPQWYLDMHMKCLLPTYTIQILRNQLIIFKPQVEIPNFPSTHALAIDIGRVTAGILLGKASITLLTRERKNPIQVEVPTIHEIPGYGIIPTIHDPGFKNKAKALFFALFELNPSEISFIESSPTSLKFILMSLIYIFKKHRKRNILQPIGLAVLLLFLKPIFLSQKHQVILKDVTFSNLIRCQGWTNELIDFFERFDTPAIFTKVRPYQISYAYTYCQFQTLLMHSVFLSKLLGNPFRLPQLSLLNSHFVYNVTRAVCQGHKVNSTQFIQLYFSSAHGHLPEIFTQFLDILPKVLSTDPPDEEPGNLSLEEEDDHTEDVDTEEQEEFVNVNISNRFSKLRVK